MYCGKDADCHLMQHADTEAGYKADVRQFTRDDLIEDINYYTKLPLEKLKSMDLKDLNTLEEYVVNLKPIYRGGVPQSKGTSEYFLPLTINGNPVLIPGVLPSINSPNPPVMVIVVRGVIFHVTFAVAEGLLIIAHIAAAPLVVSDPPIGVPAELILGAGTLGVTDLAVANASYMARVAANPTQHQDFELAYPWDLLP